MSSGDVPIVSPLKQSEPIDERVVNRVLDLLPDAVVLTDEGGTIVLANRRITALLGYAPEEVVGQSVEMLVPERYRRTHVAQREGFASQAQARQMGAGPELFARHKDGTEIPVDIGLAPVPTERGRRIAAVIRDVTERRRYAEMEKRLLHADRLIAVGQLAAGIAHEINNPAAYVVANLSAASDLLGELEQALRQGDTVHGDALIQVLHTVIDENIEGMERMRRIVGELQGFSRLESEGIAPTNLNEVVEAASRIVRNELRHKAQLDLELGELPPLTGDAARLGQVVVDLLLNAAQAIPEGSPDANRVRVATAHEANKIRLEVEDTGAGMTEDVRKRIFEPFFTTRHANEGTGLGLTLVADIVHKHGGEIRCESTPGVGTRMEVLLPVETGLGVEIEAPRGPRPLAVPETDSGRILFIDDEAHMLEAVERLLGRHHDIETARSGEEALERLETDRDFDVIICDLVMPGLDGVGVYEAVAKKWPELVGRLVFMTGGAFTPRAKAFLAAADNRVLRKPVDVSELRGVIADVMAFNP